MINMFTVDHSRITGYLPKNDSIKQYFCLLPFNDTSRHLLYLKNILYLSMIFVALQHSYSNCETLTVFEHLICCPLDDKDES